METVIVEYEAKWEVPTQAWKKFMDEAVDFESNTKNFRFPFKVMTKKYGQQYIEYCRASWITCKDIMTVEEFCNMNDMPEGFFRGRIEK